MASPEIVSDFSPVSEHNNPARGETQKVLNIVLALKKEKKKHYRIRLKTGND